MIETREYRGFWWLPEDDQRRLSGTLTLTEGDPRLELLDNFGHHLLCEGEGQRVYSHALEERPRILGVSVDGKHITLEQANVLASSMHFPGIPTSTYAHGVALVGAHFLPDEEIVFDEISIEATDLNAWALISGFDINVGMKKHEEHEHFLFTKIDVGFESPDDIEIPLARGERAFIRFSATSSGLGPLTAEVNLRQDAALHLHFARRAALAQVFKRVGQLRNFLSLAVGRPVTILSVTGYQDDFVHPQTGDRIPIELLWGIPHNPEPPTRARQPHEMLFTLHEAKPDISRVMKAWFAKQEKLEPVFSLFFGSRYHPDLGLDVLFLLHVQAAETYDYRRRRKPGLESFAMRIANVLDRCKTVAKQIVGAGPSDRTDFIEAVKVARNYYTHYNPKLENKVARGASLYLLLIQLQASLETALLRELGFPAKTIHEILGRIGRYADIQHFKRVVAEEQNAT